MGNCIRPITTTTPIQDGEREALLIKLLTDVSISTSKARRVFILEGSNPG